MPGSHMSGHPRVGTSLGQASLFAPPDNLGTMQALNNSEVSWTQINVKYSNIPINTVYRLEMSPPRTLLFGHGMRGCWYWRVLFLLYFCLSQLLVQWSFSASNERSTPIWTTPFWTNDIWTEVSFGLTPTNQRGNDSSPNPPVWEFFRWIPVFFWRCLIGQPNGGIPKYQGGSPKLIFSQTYSLVYCSFSRG